MIGHAHAGTVGPSRATLSDRGPQTHVRSRRHPVGEPARQRSEQGVWLTGYGVIALQPRLGMVRHMTTENLRVSILGSIGAEYGGRPVELGGAFQRRLLGILATADHRVVSADRLVEELWEDAPPDAAKRTLRTYVARLRRSLEAAGAPGGSTLVVTDSPGYRLSAEVLIDADAFERQIDAGRDHLAVGEAATAWQELDAGLAMWSGDALGEFAGEAWAMATAVRLEELRLVARELRIRAQIDSGHHDQAIAEIEALIAEHPLREAPRHDQMMALYRSGRHAEALRAGRAYAEYLADETGLEPSTTITDLEALIIDRDPRLDAVPHGRRRRGYLLEEPIGAGALGSVHRAKQPSIDRDVAITVISAEFADDPAFVRGFEARAQEVASIEHAAIVPVYDYWREPGGAYLVLRYYPGGTLADRLADGPLPAEEAEAIARQVTSALWAAHQRGIAHGNVAPSSVWFDDEGRAVLGGFGLIADEATPRADIADLATVIDMLVSGATSPNDTHRRLAAMATRVSDPADSSIATAYDLLRELDGGVTSVVHTNEAALVRVTGPNPFKGLAAFSEADAERFFGRDAIVDELAGMVRRRRVAALMGPSGSGKSSVMRAGLLARLRAGGSYITTMVPGVRPLDELEVALTRIAAVPLRGLAAELAVTDGRLATVLRSIMAAPDGDIVLAIDQFEELFTISLPEERNRFLDVLVDAIDSFASLRVVVTCRADFLGRVLEHPVAGALLRDRCVLVTPLTNEELHDAVIGPAEHAGVAVEPALVAEIVGEAYGSPGSLPMVQYALTEVFESASDGVMTLADYQRLGGVSGVLAQRAEEIFSGLSPDDRAAAHHLFSRLVRVGEGASATRRRALRSELLAVPDSVVDAFGRARLVSFDREESTREPTVEVTHEALITNWPRLAGWIADEADGLRLLNHLSTSAAEWAAADREASLVYRGARLEAAQEWVSEHPGQLSELEAGFLAASGAVRDAEVEREQRSVRRLRRLTSGLAVFLAVALAATALAVVAQGNADDRAEEVADTRAQAQVAALAGNAKALAGENPVTAMLLAAEASARSSATDPAVATALLDALSTDPRERTLYPAVRTVGLNLTPSGSFYTYVFANESGSTIEIVNVDDATTRSFDLDFSPTAAITDPSGRYLFTVRDDRLLLLDASTGEPISDQPVFDYFVSLSSTDGQNIAAVDANGDIAIRTLPDFDGITLIEGLPGITTIARSADGNVVAALDDAGNLLVAPIGDPEGRVVLPLPTPARFIELDTNGERLAIADTLGQTFIADLTDPEAPPVVVDIGAVSDLVFSPDGGLLAIGTGTGIEVIDTSTGERAADPVAFAPGVQMRFRGPRVIIAFAPNQGIVEIDLDAPSRIVERVEPEGWAGVGFHTPDQSVVVALTDDGSGPSWYAISNPSDPANSTRVPVAQDNTSYSVALGEGRHMTADTTTSIASVWEGNRPVDEIDLTGAATPGFWHLRTPRIGADRDLLILAQDGEAILGNELVVIDRTTSSVVTTIRDRNINIAEFANDDQDQLMVGFIDGLVRWLDLDGNPIGDDVDVGAGVGAIARTADDSLSAVGDWSGTITLLDAERQVVGELFNDAPFPVHMAFVGDGARLVVQSEDGSIVLWDVPSRARIGTVYRADGLRGPFVVTSDGASILVSDSTGIAIVSIDPAEWERIACATANRQLTTAEIQAIVPGLDPVDGVCSS